MQYSIIRFFLINLFICILTGILLLTKHVCRHILTSHMQYHLWFLLLGLLTVPFLPFRLTGFPMLLARLLAFCNPALPDTRSVVNQGDVAAPAEHQTICPSPPKSGNPQTIPPLPERTPYQKRDSHIQYRIFAVAGYHRVPKAAYLSSHPHHLRLQ